MSAPHHARGGATIADITHMDAWEAGVIRHLRLWCEGPTGQWKARDAYRHVLPVDQADRAWQDFGRLLARITGTSARPLVRHAVHCTCVGSDECVFLHLVRTASDGHLNDAALIATLLSGPAHAEHIAVMAGAVGTVIRRIHADPSPHAVGAPAVVRLH